MNISSVQSYTSLFESKEHPAGCQCPGCCKDKSSDSISSEDDLTTIDNPNSNNAETSDGKSNKTGEAANSTELTQSEQQVLMQLQQRDSEVRSHEAAHIAAGGSVVSGSASFTYQKGPDGRQYAVGGEVSISSSGGNTPEEKIAIARQIQAGALAPANPSPQDLKVASSAAMMEAQAKQDLALEKSEEQKQQAVNTYSSNQDETEQGSQSKLQLQA